MERSATDLGLRVVFRLQFAADHGVFFVRIDQVGLVVADDARGARVDEGLDAAPLAGGDDGPRALDVDLVEDLVGDGAGALGRGRGGVDDDVGAQAAERLQEAVRVGDVGLDVHDAVAGRAPVPLALEIDDGDLALPVAQEQVHDVVAQEAAPANDENAAEQRLLDGSHWCYIQGDVRGGLRGGVGVCRVENRSIR